MRLNATIGGLKPFQKKLLAKANRSAIQKVVRLNTAELTAGAQRRAPVSTEETNPGGHHGQLRESITPSIEPDGMAGVVRAEVDYVEYVEKGTRFMAPQPYMKPAFEEQKPKFLRDLKKGDCQVSQLNPSTELFAAVLARLLKAFPDRVFSTVMPPEGTPYPFIYISAAHEIEDFRMKGAWFGQAGLSINVWHNDPSQRGTVDSLLFSIRQICRGLEQTENYSWCLSQYSLETLPDYTTDQPLYRGIISLEFKHYRRKN